MLLSAVSVLVVAQSSSEIPEGLMNNPVYTAPCGIKQLCILPPHSTFFVFMIPTLRILALTTLPDWYLEWKQAVFSARYELDLYEYIIRKYLTYIKATFLRAKSSIITDEIIFIFIRGVVEN